MKNLERNSHIPLYKQLAQTIEHDIKTGRLKPFESLPTSKQLTERYQVSRITVNQAFALLSEKGFIVTKQGKGSFVTGPTVQHELSHIKGLGDSLIEQGLNLEFDLLQYELVEPPQDVCDQLDFGTEGAIRYKRIYREGENPFAYTVGYLPATAGTISFAEAEKRSALSIIEDTLDIQIVRADTKILVSAAGKEIGSHLNVPSSEKLLTFKRLYYSNTGARVTYSEFYLVSEEYYFEINVHGHLPIGSAIKKSDE